MKRVTAFVGSAPKKSAIRKSPRRENYYAGIL
jgi:hypothetical protein